MSDPFLRFVDIFREIFQFDSAALDFGIYRILNEKREQIEDYLNTRLPQVIDQALAQYAESDREALQGQLDALHKQLENAARVLGQPAFYESGELVTTLRERGTGMEYLAVRARLAQIEANDVLKRSVYNDLANFFERYYQDGDYISKRKRGRDEKYVIPYDGQEVVLYWANQDQYYVKTGEQFRNYRFKAGGYAVQFELRAASTAQNNNKGSRYFVLADNDAIQWDEQANTLTIYFEYRLLTEKEQQQHGRTAQQRPQDSLNSEAAAAVIGKVNDPTLKAHLALVKEGEEQSSLLKHLTQFTRRNTADFFIHKDLAAYLRRELEFFIKNEVLVLDDLIGGTAQATGDQVRRARVVRDVGHNIITLLAQIEDFQKRLFEKKKFVTRTEYCVTIDRVPEALWPVVLANSAQIAEWRELYSLNELLAETPLLNNGMTEAALRQYPSLVVDTRHLNQPFKDALLASFNDLDEATDGLLIHSENWQALNLLAERYREQIQCIYIDPPYNTDASSIIYKNNYKHSSWMSLFENRLALASHLMTNTGIICTAIDDEEVSEARHILEHIFAKQIGVAIVRANPQSRKAKETFSPTHEYALFYGQSIDSTPGSLEISEKRKARFPKQDEKGRYAWMNFIRTGANDKRADRPKLFYPIYVSDEDILRIPDMIWSSDSGEYGEYILHEEPRANERAVYPITEIDGQIEKNWHRGHIRVALEPEEYRIRRDAKGNISIDFKTRIDEDSTPTTWWDNTEYASANYGAVELKALFGSKLFDFPKALTLVMDCLRAANVTPSSVTLDYFAGSGTTGHAIFNLNREDGGQRKFILVEMGEYLDTIVLPRLKKVIFTPEWKNGKPQRMVTPEEAARSPSILKVIRLESYEDTLNSLERPRHEEGQLALDYMGDPYLLRYMLDFETRGSPSLLNVEALQSPFDYKLTVRNGLEAEPSPVDLVETFNYLLGLVEKQRRAFDHDGRRYVAVWGTQGRDNIIIVWRNTAGIIDSEEGLLADRDFIRDTIIPAFLGDGWPDRLLVNGMATAERDGVAAESLDGLFHQRMFAGTSGEVGL